MRKARLDTKSEKSADPSLVGENPDEDEALSSTGGAKMTEIKKDEGLAGERKTFVTLLKQVLLFLPGTFLLFFMSFGLGIIFMEIVVYRRAFEMLPDDYPFQFALMGLIILLGALMIWVGLGDIKNRKHFAIPASLIMSGAVIGAFTKALSKIWDIADRMLDDFTYLIYLLPLALIIPILAKSIVDRKTEDA